MSKKKPIDFLDEFIDVIKENLDHGEIKWGDTWLHRTIGGQEQRIQQYINDQFDRFHYTGRPVQWEAIAGEALIGWIRENHPELFPDKPEETP